MSDSSDKSRLVGINHVVLEVGDIDEALEFYGGLFDFEFRSRSDTAAFLDMGDQFLALSEGREQGPDVHRHFGLVVDDRQPIFEALEETEAERIDGASLDFLDPWGNRIQVIDYRDIQFTKSDAVLEGMGMGDLEKTDDAMDQLRAKGLAGDATAGG
jgi:catechol 2,3-dioxygenase-like lactoylglutathione lyase family enzyme